MRQEAADFEQNSSLDIESIDIFVTADVPATLNDSEVTTADIHEWVSTAEAAMRLKKSERTIQRRAKFGKLKSKLDDSGHLLVLLPTANDTNATPDDKPATSDDTSSKTFDENTLFFELLKEKDSKIEALSMRAGYLEAQLQHAQDHVKLLTDSQHKRGNWSRFWSWFAGR